MTSEPHSIIVLATALGFACLLGLRGRSRKARAVRSLNRALHEVRRPLQALALVSPGPQGAVEPGGNGLRRVVAGASLHDPVRQAIQALADLDRAINGGPAGRARSELVAVKLMADTCVRRWLPRARLAGCQLELRWSGQDVLVRGDGLALAGALENLILNAIEHGGDRIEVSGATDGRSVMLTVVDSGSAERAGHGEVSGEGPSAAPGSRGHGLGIVDETASAHGGRLETCFDPSGSRAGLILPLARVSAGAVRKVRVNW